MLGSRHELQVAEFIVGAVVILVMYDFIRSNTATDRCLHHNNMLRAAFVCPSGYLDVARGLKACSASANAF